MISKRSFLSWFICGLLIFAAAMVIHAPLIMTAVPGGILDHQAAGSAVRVDEIHRAWSTAGLTDTATYAMLADIVFIIVYGIGVVTGGMYYARSSSRALHIIGLVALWSGVAFLITDLGETSLQLVQLTQGAGDDTMAAIAAALGPPKVAGFFIGFFAIIAALLVDWRSGKAG